MIGEHLHAKQVDSVTNAVVGLVQAVSLSIHAIGAGLAAVSGGQSTHAIKQVDRLLSNSALNLWALFAHWVPDVVATTPALVVALDWSDFDADDHALIALSLVTAHGRALPLVWRTVRKSQLKGRRAQYESEVLLRLHEVMPAGVRVTVLADRGFGDQELYAQRRDCGFDFVVRFRGDVTVERAQGESRPARAWVPTSGHTRRLRAARVTCDRTAVDAVVCVKARGMREPWCLAVGGATLTGPQAVRLYGRRFTIEETFRDVKDPRYGLGMSATHIGDPRRRDRRARRSHAVHLAAATRGLRWPDSLRTLERPVAASGRHHEGRQWPRAAGTDRRRLGVSASGQRVAAHANASRRVAEAGPRSRLEGAGSPVQTLFVGSSVAASIRTSWSPRSRAS